MSIQPKWKRKGLSTQAFPNARQPPILPATPRGGLQAPSRKRGKCYENLRSLLDQVKCPGDTIADYMRLIVLLQPRLHHNSGIYGPWKLLHGHFGWCHVQIQTFVHYFVIKYFCDLLAVVMYQAWDCHRPKSCRTLQRAPPQVAELLAVLLGRVRYYCYRYC